MTELNDDFIMSYSDDLNYLSMLPDVYESNPFVAPPVYFNGFVFRMSIISTVGNIETLLESWSIKSLKFLLNYNQFSSFKDVIDFNNILIKDYNDGYINHYLEEHDFFSLKLFSGSDLSQIENNIEKILNISTCETDEKESLKKILERYFAIKILRNAIIHHDLSESKKQILVALNFTTDIFISYEDKKSIEKIVDINKRLMNFINSFYVKKIYGNTFFKKYMGPLSYLKSQTKFENRLNFYLDTDIDPLPEYDPDRQHIRDVYYKNDIFHFFRVAMSKILRESKSIKKVTPAYLSSASYILEQFSNLAFSNFSESDFEHYFEILQKIVSTSKYSEAKLQLFKSPNLLIFLNTVTNQITNETYISLTRLLAHHSSPKKMLIERKHIILSISWIVYIMYEKDLYSEDYCDYKKLIYELINLMPNRNKT